MVLVYERSPSIPYAHGVIFQFTSLKCGLGYRFQWRHGASWRLKPLPSNHWQPDCFFFKSSSMITPQSFVIMAYYEGNPSDEGDFPHKGPDIVVSISICGLSVCGRFGLWPFRFVAVPVCGRSGLWPFRSVAVSDCGRFGLWPFRSVAVGRSGLWPFRFWPFRFVAVMTRILRHIHNIKSNINGADFPEFIAKTCFFPHNEDKCNSL